MEENKEQMHRIVATFVIQGEVKGKDYCGAVAGDFPDYLIQNLLDAYVKLQDYSKEPQKL